MSSRITFRARCSGPAFRDPNPVRGVPCACPSRPSVTFRPLSDVPPTIRRPFGSAWSISASAPSTGRIRPSYLDDRLAAGERDWAVCGASLRSPETAEALVPQDGLYTLAVRSGEGERSRVIGAVRRLLVAPADPAALLAAMADPGVRIVSLTVTEKGYCHDPATGELDETHPDIRADLADPGRPRSAPGFLVEALRRRREAGVPPFTVLSCDNLPANGRTVARVLGRLAALRDPELGRFVAGEVAVPLHHGRSHRPRHHGCRPGRSGGGARNGGRLAGRHRAFHAVGDRGPLRRRPTAAGGSRRRARGRCGALRADEAAPAQRQSLDARLSRPPRRARDGGRSDRRPRFRPPDPRPHGRGGDADAARPARQRSSRLQDGPSCSASPTRP